MRRTTVYDFLDLTSAQWRKSSYSHTGTDCVEVANHPSPAVVPVRDSKNPHGPALIFTAPAWSSFIVGLKAGI
ncbi:DUF397 domain-containing protein [Streptomyces abikoensis]|uniref:DUF397 domain-containing protein n=1 Tax=Streptomyces TaxID=1883 RepID=UPI0033EEF089